MRHDNSGVFDGSLPNTAIFIDYDNLHEVMRRRAPSGSEAHEVLLELVEDVCRSLAQQQIRATAIAAYADFSAYAEQGAEIQRRLSSIGIDPRYVSATWQANAAELRLCVEATDLLCTRPAVESLVVLSGDRPYLPLLQLVRKHGRQARLVLLDPLRGSGLVPFLSDSISDVSSLLSRDGQALPDFTSEPSSDGSGSDEYAAPPRSPADYTLVTEPLCITALEIIDEHFGQYDEIYLTPLLRKLTESLEEENCDPKTLVSALEEAGAVWLEKRRGFPHDYTVLLLDRNHPDLLRIEREGQASWRVDGDSYASQQSSDGRMFD